jgi:hypothetical protein
LAVSFVALTMATLPAAANEKNWSPPAAKIFAQSLSDKIMAEHPELVSVTFHGVPPGSAPGTYTMFAGSFPERIGNKDDPDDVDISEKGITILDTRWKKVNDTVKKVVVMAPLRDVIGENVGEIVIAFKNDGAHHRSETEFFAAGLSLRDGLQKSIPTYAALFAPGIN